MKNFYTNKKLAEKLPYIYITLFPLFIYLIFEILNTTSETLTKPGMLSNLPVVFISSVALLLIMVILFSLTGNMFISGVIMTVFVGFFYVLSYYWLLKKGFVFSPSEIGLITKSKGIVKFSDISIYPIMYPTAFFLIIGWVLLFLASKKVKLDLKKRMICLSFSLTAILFLFCSNFSTNNILPQFNIDINSKAPINQTYKSNGVLLGFYTSYFYVQDEMPEDYNYDALAGLTDSAEDSGDTENIPAPKPNVIVIMSESFFDPTILPNITYTADPATNIQNLQKSSTGSSILSPVFGGSTCNTEYEFLTGNAIVFAGYGVIPFENEGRFIPTNDPLALPQMFKDNGYKTVSVHPYKQDFFNRNSIHPKLGFEKSIFVEDMIDAPIKGEFVSDEYFTDLILDEINSSEVPLFLYGISMQNHYYYDPGKYDEYDVNCLTNRLDEFQTGSVDAYAQGAYDADKQLGRLIDEISKSDRPTIVVFFGDHLPLLGRSAFEVYDALDYIDGTDMSAWNNEDTDKMFSTPYIVWNNYGLEKENWGHISPYFLGALVAKQADVNLNGYYEFLLQSYNSFHGMTEYLFIDNNDNISKKPTQEGLPTVEKFRSLQYYRIFGKHLPDSSLHQTMK